MFNDIFKIIQIYVKKYFIFILILLAGFVIVSGITTANRMKELKDDIAGYEFEKNIGNNKRIENSKIINVDEQEKNSYKLTTEKIKYIENFNGKLSKKELTEMQNRFAVDVYLGRISEQSERNFYRSGDINVVKQREQYFKYLSQEEKNNLKKYNELKAKSSNNGKNTGKNIEMLKIYPEYFGDNPIKIKMFVLENFEKSKTEVKETLHNENTNIMYIILMLVIVVTIFGFEYHTNFGKFIASLPFKKEKIYFAKLILTIIIVAVAYLLVGISNVLVVKNSVISELYSITNTFTAHSKIFILGLGIVILGAISSSFCGSIISIIAMYVPLLTLHIYPIMIFYIIWLVVVGKKLIIEHIVISPNSVPIAYYVTYVEWKYILIWLGVMFIISLLMSKVYKKHNIESEGKFFTINIIDKLLYLYGVLGIIAGMYAILGLAFFVNKYIITVISVVLIPIITWKLMNIKLRI
ncbi:hypothetical protein CG018_01315 [Gemella sp. ND 6198]|uniref:hypothetical protein n=1 Tax=Gemella sp. ND 6198 TaxID=2040624 RepID=UPI000E0C067B|nr:hypothetical protein [Gemella sp. ND 6198]AXI26176.1 hypothetical protein CG018_01315 [Gemella sp. ND 6198]